MKRKSKKVQKYSKKVDWVKAPDITKRISHLVDKLHVDWVDKRKVFAFRSRYSKTRAYARIWGLGRIWQQALNITPSYIVEVISERYDKLSDKQKDEVLIHELTHIPKNFSGALVPHTRKRKGSFHDKIKGLISDYRKHNL
ncbi:putative metallopeptidase [Patescibacteria group bacterium]